MGGNMQNVFIILIIAVIVVNIIIYLYKAKKSGVKCVGCPYAKQCGGNCGGNSQTRRHD